MVKAFDPTKSINAARDRVEASKARQEKLQAALEKRETALAKATENRDRAQKALEDEKGVEAMSQRFVDRNTAVEPDGVPDGYVPPVEDDEDDPASEPAVGTFTGQGQFSN